MPLDRLAPAAALALVLTLGACAGGTATRPEAPAKTQATMSNKGLANLQLAQNYLRAGKLELALDRAGRAYRHDPDAADVQLVLGMIQLELKDDERAGEHFARAVELSPRAGHVLNARAAWLCEQRRWDEAEAMFDQAVRDPFYDGKRQAYYNAGRCQMLAGRNDRAEAPLRKGLELAPEDPALLEQMTRLQLAQGNFLGARAFFQRREAVGEVGPELLELAVRIEQGAGDAAAADRYRARLQQQFPDHTPTAREGTPQS